MQVKHLIAMLQKKDPEAIVTFLHARRGFKGSLFLVDDHEVVANRDWRKNNEGEYLGIEEASKNGRTTRAKRIKAVFIA